MPNRIIKESICTSESIDSLSWFEEVLFYRLIVNCDDYGCFDRRAKIIKASLFPLKEVTTKQIDAAIDKLSTAGMVRLYEREGRPYLQLAAWSKHQRFRNSKHKYPTPEENDVAEGCENSPQVAASCREIPLRARVFENPNPNPNPIGNILTDISCAEPEPVSTPEPAKTDESGKKWAKAAKKPKPEPEYAPVDGFLLSDGTEFRPTIEQYNEFCRLYPGVDVKRQFSEMCGWCLSNPGRRKTRAGALRFINGWLSREQNRSKAPAKAPTAYVPEYIRQQERGERSGDKVTHEKLEELRQQLAEMNGKVQR